MQRQLTLARRAQLVLLLFLAPMVAAFVALSWWETSSDQRQRAHDDLAHQAAFAGGRIDEALRSLVAECAALGRNPVIANAIADGAAESRIFLGPLLSSLHLSVPGAHDLHVMAFNGSTIWPASTNGISDDERPLLAKAIASGQPAAAIANDDLLIMQPILYAPTGTYEGALSVHVPLARILGQAAGSVQAELLLRAEGQPVAGRPAGSATVEADYALGTGSLEALRFELVASIPQAQIEAPLHRLLLLHLVLGTTALVGAALGIRLIVRHLTSRLERLSAAATEVGSSGNAGLSVPDLGGDEVGNLAQTLRVMLGELARARGELESQVALRTAQLSEALTMGRMGAWSFEASTGLFTFTDEFYALFRTTAAAEGGPHMSPAAYAERFIPAEYRDIVATEAGAALASTDPAFHRVLDHPVIFADGSSGHIEVHVRAVRDAQGRVVQLVGVNQDITERKRLESALAAARDAAEADNRAKSAFLATMSHEIRTPLNGVIGMASLLEDTSLNAQQHSMLATITSSGQHLLTVLNDILDYSKIEAGQFELEQQPLSPGVLVHEVVQLNAGLARERGLHLEMSSAAEVPTWVAGDMVRLRQVLGNLASNAVKFTPSGSVTLRLDTAPAPEGRVGLTIAVIDTGIGIPVDRLPYLFQPFVQVDASMTRRFGGTGLGLAISRRLVRMMDGDIVVSETPGGGTTFTVTVLLHPASAPATTTREGAMPELPHRRILLAEDNPVNRNVAAAMLKRLGQTVLLAENGQQAVALLARERVDLVLMDCQMPVLDGFAACQQVRDPTSAVLDHGVPVIALTANAMQGDRNACLAAGMDDHLSKPITLPLLAQALGRWLDRRSDRSAP
jgi:signal transduction histidine kinase/CheY-like chemotaxis protein